MSEEHWRSRAGAWLGIGASPGALLVGAGLAARHEGPPPVLSIVVGAVVMALILAGQGALGLAPPAGEGTTLSIAPLNARQAVAAVAVPGLVLAAVRFDRLLLPWLGVLAATLPPLVVPLAVERVCRRRGAAARLVPTWTWLPGSALAIALAAAGEPVAPVAGLLVAGLATALWRRLPVDAAIAGEPSTVSAGRST